MTKIKKNLTPSEVSALSRAELETLTALEINALSKAELAGLPDWFVSQLTGQRSASRKRKHEGSDEQAGEILTGPPPALVAANLPSETISANIQTAQAEPIPRCPPAEEQEIYTVAPGGTLGPVHWMTAAEYSEASRVPGWSEGRLVFYACGTGEPMVGYYEFTRPTARLVQVMAVADDSSGFTASRVQEEPLPLAIACY